MQTTLAARLENRSILRIGGADRRAFLQGLISNDIGACIQDHAIYAALLTPQGKFLHDLFIVDTGETFLVDCETARADDLLRKLAAYKLRAKVTFADAGAEFDVWALWPAPETGALIYADPRLAALGARAILAKTIAPADVTATDFASYDRHRLALGIADGSRDLIVEKSALLEGNFDYLNGASWTKGCYVGQELTARMHHRMLVKKRLLPVTIEGPAPAFGSIVTLNGEDIGDMRSSAGNLGLALLNMEKAESAMRANIALDCDGSMLKPSRPDWLK